MAEFSIHRAADEGHLDMVRQLIEGGVSVDSRDSWDQTPLHWAAEGGRCEVAELLISSKCDLNPKDRDGRTPVLSAARMGAKSVVHVLLHHGAQVNCVDDDGGTLLLHASGYGWTDIVQRIVDRGEADPNAATIWGSTPLNFAAVEGHEDIAALLIRAGAEVNHEARKWTALHMAAFHGRTRVVRVLLEKEGLNLNPQNELGDTPLHSACACSIERRPEVLEQLLVAEADTTLKNIEGETALSKGIRLKHLTLDGIRLFVQHGVFLEECDYVRISQDPVLKESVLKDVGLCTHSIVNKFHRQSLPALEGNPYFAGKLPSIHKFELLPEHVRDVENFVKCDIEANTFCNVIKARPIVLRMMCVESLLA